METEIVLIKTDKLIPYALNNRVHGDSQVGKIAESIKRFGFNQPLVVDEDLIVLVGHGRLLAAKKLDMQEVPVIVKQGLSETQKRAYRILDNKLQNDSTWDFESLKIEIDFLDADNFDTDFWGLQDLLIDIDESELKQGEDVEAEERDDSDVFLKEGDLVELNKHALYVGDAHSSQSDGSILLSSADFVCTDPPYELGYDKIYEITKYCPHMLIMCTMKQARDIFATDHRDFRFDLVWDQRVPSSMLNKKVPYYVHKNLMYMSCSDESIFSCDNAKGFFSEKGYYPSIIEAPKNTSDKHGLTKNLKSWVAMLSGFSFKVCYDPFLGSGTTLLACEQLKKQCIGSELMPKYCHLIIDRWKNYMIENKKPFTIKVNGDVLEVSNK